VISAYALVRRWSVDVLVPTAQVVLLGINLIALVSKGMPRVDGVVWGAAGAALLVGVLAGDAVARRLDAETARRAVAVLALLGGLATIVRGVLTS
jgi:uncharacterized protein